MKQKNGCTSIVVVVVVVVGNSDCRVSTVQNCAHLLVAGYTARNISYETETSCTSMDAVVVGKQ